jgi:HEAT repeat protein
MLQRSSRRAPIEAYVDDLERRIRYEARLIRLLVGRLEGVERTRAELLEEITDPKRRPKGDELSERFFWLGLIGDGYVVDEFIRLANPDVVEDPLHLDLLRHPLLNDPYVRRDFFQTLGTLGAMLRETDFDRLLALTRLLRRGLADTDHQVQIASADAVSRSVKYHKVAFESFRACVEPLVELLFSPEWAVRRAAAATLAELPDPRAMRGLQHLIERESDESLKAFAETCVKRLRDRLSFFRYLRRPVNSLRERIGRPPGT